MGRRTPIRSLIGAGVAAALIPAWYAPTRAQEPPLDLSAPRPAEADTGPAEAERRLDFLTRRLEEHELEGDLWYFGWLGLYGVGLVTRSVQATTTDDGDDRLAAIVRAGKTTIGITQMLLDPLPTRLGADDLVAGPDATPDERLARVRAAEARLEESAAYARRKYTLRPHLGNAVINLAAGGIIWAFGDWEDAAVSTGLGLAFGEARILTIPEGPIGSLEAYDERFGGVRDTGWSIVPRRNGAALVYRF